MSEQEEIDLGWQDYVDSLDDAEFVDVGILPEPGAQSAGSITLAQLAAIQEFGTEIAVTSKMRGFLAANGLALSPATKTITIPSRPYMRQTFDEEESNLAKMVDEKDKAVLAGTTTRKKALEEIGQTHRQDIQKSMSTKGKFKENHPFTVQRKKSSTPLIDTGGLRQAIDYQVQ